jgi:hypothetical protein
LKLTSLILSMAEIGSFGDVTSELALDGERGVVMRWFESRRGSGSGLGTRCGSLFLWRVNSSFEGTPIFDLG